MPDLFEFVEFADMKSGQTLPSGDCLLLAGSRQFKADSLGFVIQDLYYDLQALCR